MIYCIGLLLVVCIIVLILKNGGDFFSSTPNYKKFDSLVTKVESVLLLRLENALKDTHYKVYCQVALNRIVKPYSRNKKKNFKLSRQIGSKSIDFVVDREHKIKLVIELDDNSHNSTSAKKRDLTKNKILDDANVPLIRFHVKKLPSEFEIKNLFLMKKMVF